MAKVIIVDDETMILRFVSRVLSREGHEVTLCESGADALGHDLRELDLAILDILMPGMSGTQLAVRMRADGFRGPIILATGNPGSFADHVSALVASGVVEGGPLWKPYTAEELISKVNTVNLSSQTD